MDDQLELHVPLSEVLPADLWPDDLLDSQAGELLTNIIYEGGEISGDETSWEANVQLSVIEEVIFTLPLLKGVSLVLGVGSVNASVYGGADNWGGNIAAETLLLRIDTDYYKSLGIANEEPPSKIEINLTNFQLNRECLAISWSEKNMNRWLKLIAGNFLDQSAPIETEVSLRLVFGPPFQEIRLDWAVSGSPRTFVLPGLKLTTPKDVLFSLIFSAGVNNLSRLLFCLTFDDEPDEQGSVAQLVASSNFAWERDSQREISNDEDRPDDPLLQLKLTPQNRVSLVLFDLDLNLDRLPRFFYQLSEPLTQLDIVDTVELALPTNLAGSPLSKEDWKLDFKANWEKSKKFVFPFLQQKPQKSEQVDDPFSQYIELHPPASEEITLDFEDHRIKFSVGITLKFGPIALDSEIELAFNWESFAFQVKHTDGVALYSKEAVLPAKEHLGLTWRLKGKKNLTLR